MKKIRKIAVSVLSVSMVVGMASCGGGGGGGRAEVTVDPNAEAATTTALSTTTWQTNETDAEVQEAAANLDLDTTLTVDKKLKWMAWWPMDETSAMWETFKAAYGVPEDGDESYGDAKDKCTVYLNVAYEDRYNALGKAITAGDSPDLFPFEITYFPTSVIKNLFQPVDGIIDISASGYETTKADMEMFSWGGKHYCAIAPGEVTNNTLLWYRKSVIEEVGLDDPLTLYNEGKWDWDAFRDMLVKFQASGEGKAGLDSNYIGGSMMATTGVPMIGIEDGKLVSHIFDPAIERAQSFLEELPRNGWVPESLRNGATNAKKWINGDTLFFGDGFWFYQETINVYIKAGRAEMDDFLCVPWPKDPSADKFYAEFKNGCNLFPAGSTNVNGFKAYCAATLAAGIDETIQAANKEKYKNDYNMSEEVYELVWERYPKELVGVYNTYDGISAEMAGDYSSATEQLAKWPAVNESFIYTELRAEHSGAIEAAIAEANATLG